MLSQPATRVFQADPFTGLEAARTTESSMDASARAQRRAGSTGLRLALLATLGVLAWMPVIGTAVVLMR